jgi:hypothetical protein
MTNSSRRAAEEPLVDYALADQLLAKAEADGVEVLGPDGLGRRRDGRHDRWTARPPRSAALARE